MMFKIQCNDLAEAGLQLSIYRNGGALQPLHLPLMVLPRLTV